MEEKIVLLCSWFDWPESECISFLEQAKEYGDKLITIIGKNKTIENYLGVKPEYSEEERVERIRRLNIADTVILSPKESYFDAIIKYKPDTVVIRAWCNKVLYDLGAFLFENRITTKVVTIERKRYRKPQ